MEANGLVLIITYRLIKYYIIDRQFVRVIKCTDLLASDDVV